MRIIKYVSENNERLYDFNTIKNILGVNKSKLQRDMKTIKRDYVKHKNQYLYKEKTLFQLMENRLFQKLDKMKLEENELSKD